MRASTARALLFLALLGWCAALLVYRHMRAGSIGIGSLPWNLFLASIPPVAADLLKRISDRGWPLALQGLLFVVWLLFLPNGPYLITDFIHLKERPDMPLWYDIALMTSVAAVGLLLTYASVADVQTVITRAMNAMTAWIVVAASLLLSGFGIYLGRFLRWNSWDAVSNPRQLFADITAQLANPDDRTVGVTVIYGTALLLGYIALRVYALTTVRRDAPR
jgi:uncharacterized membrane protein